MIAMVIMVTTVIVVMKFRKYKHLKGQLGTPVSNEK